MHEGHDVVEIALAHLREVRLYCRTCRVTSPGKVRDLTPEEVDNLDPMSMSLSRFD